jgi:phosphohistidine phosphatase
VGADWRRHDVEFDGVLASPARRVAETLDLLAGTYGRRLTVEWRDELYLASLPTLLGTVASCPDAARRLLVVGHNPGLSELLRHVSAQDDLAMPTACTAQVRLALDDWHQLAAGSGTLVRYRLARDLTG